VIGGVISLTLVNSIHPGLIQTDMGEQTFVSRARNLGTNDVDAVRQQAMFAALDRPKRQVIKLLTSPRSCSDIFGEKPGQIGIPETNVAGKQVGLSRPHSTNAVA
jgi:NAD(P)-dependent dehydrogenase (short-subunit alcohol dehydrogenase family)